MKFSKRKIALCLMAILTTASIGITAYAAEELPDLNKTGSISITVNDTETKRPVTDGSLTLYQVADLQAENKQYSYQFTDDFEDCGLSLNHIGSAKLAAALGEYISSRSESSGERMELSNSGTADFSNLPVGLYLVVQDTAAENYSKLQPFLVSIPMKDGDKLIYDVNATPKAGTVTQTPPDTPTTPDTPNKSNTTKKSTSSKLPKTGQLWWPVMLLDVTGMLLIALGWRRNRNQTEGNV